MWHYTPEEVRNYEHALAVSGMVCAWRHVHTDKTSKFLESLAQQHCTRLTNHGFCSGSWADAVFLA